MNKNTGAARHTQLVPHLTVARRGGLSSYIIFHLQAFASSLRWLWRTPFATLLTMIVIGVILTFPVTLYVLLQNLQTLAGDWQQQTQISLYLKPGISNEAGQVLTKVLQSNPAIASATYISPQQGLTDFETQTGFSNLLQQLRENPLPGVIIVKPTESSQSSQAINDLILDLRQYPQIDLTQLDGDWIKRLYAFINVAQHGLLLFAGLLGLTIIVAVGNTLRLAVRDQRNEIGVIKLVGGTHAFIRRPFIYMGALYGLCGGLIACACVATIMLWLNIPVLELADLYKTNFVLLGIDEFLILQVLVVAIGLGILSAWLAVNIQLHSERT